jgi:hypothetical protein
VVPLEEWVGTFFRGLVLKRIQVSMHIGNVTIQTIGVVRLAASHSADEIKHSLARDQATVDLTRDKLPNLVFTMNSDNKPDEVSSKLLPRSVSVSSSQRTSKLEGVELESKSSRRATDAVLPPSRQGTLVNASKWKEDLNNDSHFVQNNKTLHLLQEDLQFRRSMIVENPQEDQLEHQEWKLLQEKATLLQNDESKPSTATARPSTALKAGGDVKNNFTIRSVVLGALIGSMLCFSNMYFGLQTGWVTLGSLQAALLGFGFFRVFKDKFPHFTAQENVLLQTVSVACATIPIAAGFVGIIPALQLLSVETGEDFALSTGELILWSFALAFFGVFFAVPLRKQTIVVEKLTFPSGTATARLIEMLHKNNLRSSTDSSEEGKEGERVYLMQWKVLGATFGLSAVIKLLSYFAPQLNNLPIFSWIGITAATNYLWTFQLCKISECISSIFTISSFQHWDM